LSTEQLRRVTSLAEERSDSYEPIDGGTLFGGQDSLTSHEIGAIGEAGVGKFYGLPIDSDIYQYGDDGSDLTLHGWNIDVKSTATDALDLPELLVRADKELKADIYVRVHVLDWDETGARIRIVGAASREVVENREPQRHPGSTKNYVVTPRELNPLPALRTN